MKVRRIKLFLVQRGRGAAAGNPEVYTQRPAMYEQPLFSPNEIGSMYYKVAQRIIGKKLKDGELWELTIDARRVGDLDRSVFPEEIGKKLFDSMQDALAAYQKCTSDIEHPWSFPKCWVGDKITFEVVSGGEMGSQSAEIQSGTVVSVFSGESGLDYKVKTHSGYKLVEYFQVTSHGGHNFK